MVPQQTSSKENSPVTDTEPKMVMPPAPGPVVEVKQAAPDPSKLGWGYKADSPQFVNAVRDLADLKKAATIGQRGVRDFIAGLEKTEGKNVGDNVFHLLAVITDKDLGMMLCSELMTSKTHRQRLRDAIVEGNLQPEMLSAILTVYGKVKVDSLPKDEQIEHMRSVTRANENLHAPRKQKP